MTPLPPARPDAAAPAEPDGVDSVPRHAFVVPAYGHSPYLAECLASLAAQTRPSPIVVCTSSHFDGLEALCARFGAQLVCHGPNRGIAHDWNMALAQVDAEWVTVAHQDDVYLPAFAERTLALVARHEEAILAFTDYEEVDSRGVRPRALPLHLKRWLVELAMQGREHVHSRWAKTNLLRFGCPIPCPAVSLRRGGVGAATTFDGRYRVNLDWDYWLRLAQDVPGGFCRERTILVRHRIHPSSETSAGIAQGVRAAEDLALFQRMWPAPVARLLAGAYRSSYHYNQA